ncbi:DUF2807 domain-containing protein [Erythrobacter sp. JGD-13]|uniref:DUF2807 domain-containing protein n=2 Tax=Aurantiacibacter sediminis TaxID=2793064 RepID=A0ABS0N0B7_9SPHN|nr:DUF2807 domain-containing protein [Aurantiacibacter sediminis]
MEVNFEGDGVPLAELDTSGDAPIGIALIGSDTVNVTQGDTFTVTVDGSEQATGRLLFDLDGDTLAVYREGGTWDDSETATVSITVPVVEKLTIPGSGTLTSDTLTGNAELAIIGSGNITVENVEADRLEVDIPGSGSVIASGSAERLELNVVGSGDAEMSDLSVDRADVNIVGSGDATFMSDGRVEANFVGSGDVRVIGSANCESTAVGSGSLICEDSATASDAGE